MRTTIIAALLLTAACDSTPAAPVTGGADTTAHAPASLAGERLVAPGSRHVLGYSKLLGTYDPAGTITEMVDATGGKVAILTLFDRVSNPSGLALAIDGRDGWGRTEITSTQVGSGKVLPLVFAVDGERMWILPSGNIGIGTASPTQRLEINGGLRLSAEADQPACNEGARGTFWVARGAAGVADAVTACLRRADGSFGWTPL